MRGSRCFVVVASACFSFFGCPPPAEQPPVETAPVSFALPADVVGEPFLSTPWPSDLLIRKDGRLNLRTFPNPYNSATLEEYLRIFADAGGYSRNSTLAFHVDGGVDEATLPATASASVADDASMFVVELDTLRRLPIEWKHYPEGTSFFPAGTVAVNLLLGAVPRGPFALVVTSKALHKDGRPLGPTETLTALLTCGDVPNADADVADLDCAPYQKLAADLKLDAASIALVQKITPRDTLAKFLAGYHAALAYTPTVTNIVARPDDERANFRVFDGVIRLAKYQAGNAPYDTFDGESGGFVYDGPELEPGDGPSPTVQEEEDVPFVLTIPKSARPPNGWPVVINGHGTGGSLNSGVGRTPGNESFHIAAAGAAMLAISEPLHSTRDGFREGQENALTFNFFNPLAGRDNWRQSALEKVQLVTAVASLDFEDNGGTQTFDETQVGYFGHSQGGIVGGQFVPMELRIQGAMLSGAGAGFAPSLVEKVDPPPAIADIIRLVLSMPDEEEIDLFHPVPALVQTFVDDADPLNYGGYWQEQQKTLPRHLIATSGLEDTFTPKRNHAGLAGAFALPLADPIAEPLEVLDVLDIGTVGETVSGNQSADDGTPETVCMVQYPNDGHFAVFNNPDAQQIFTDFFATLFEGDGVPTITTR